MDFNCPKCGKEMSEEPKFPGLWTCPDSKIRLNDEAPFKFKCDGIKLTVDGAVAFEDELHRAALRKHLEDMRN